MYSKDIKNNLDQVFQIFEIFGIRSANFTGMEVSSARQKKIQEFNSPENFDGKLI